MKLPKSQILLAWIVGVLGKSSCCVCERGGHRGVLIFNPLANVFGCAVEVNNLIIGKFLTVNFVLINVM